MVILRVEASDEPPAVGALGIVLVNPKFSANVVNVYRLAACFGIGQVWCTGSRVGQQLGRPRKTRLPREERMRGFGRVDLIWCERSVEVLRSAGLRLVAVEVDVRADPLHCFEHFHGAEERGAAYVFGPEDGRLDESVLEKCAEVVQIPAFFSLNLASAVATVLWDRAYKLWRDHDVALPDLDPETRRVVGAG